MKMKKNVLIMTFSLEFGGVETALVNLLKNIDYSKYQIDLLITDERDVYSKEIPKEVNIIINKYKSFPEQIRLHLKKLQIKKAWEILKVYFSKDDKAKRKVLIESMQGYSDKRYDYAIAYHSNFQVQYINEIKAEKKIMYVHNNPYEKLEETKKYLDIYEKFDLICCVSEKIKKMMIELDGKLTNKIIIMPNIIDFEKIKRLAEEGETFPDQYSGVRILTVGRISQEKGYELAIETLKKLIQNKYNVKWYIIGDGGSFRKKIEKKIKRYALEEHCILLGAKKNPYTYMKDCDIYVQPSLTESYGITTIEAKLFNVPIVRTNTPGAEEQFENMKNGIITQISADGLYDGIVKYINNETLKNDVIETLKKEDKINRNSIDQIAKIEEILEKKGE